MIWSRLLPIVGTLALLSCQQSLPSPDVIAEIDGREYLYDDFKSFLDESAFDPDTVLDSKVLSALLDQMLDERLLRRLAMDTLPEDLSIGGREAAELLVAESLGGSIREAEIAQYYRLHRERFERPERVYLRQVLLTNQVAASDLRQLWAWGASYDQIVERVEEIPDAFVGQEGEFTREDLPGSFANLLFSLDVGTISDVLNTDYGFHVIQVVEHFPETQLDLGSVEDEIRRELEQKRTHEGLERLVESARERYNVRVFVRNVPFNYEGIYEQHIYKTSD